TVLFADLVGFTTLSETRDPEQVKNLVDSCFQLLARDITSFGGQVDKIVGDAIIALFGAPVAHEDDAERAVRAALRMQETLQAYRTDTGAPVHLRIGVNTGEVLVGALRAGGDYTAMGDVVNTAQRLETLAEPGAVLVGPATYAATHESVAYQPLGPVEVKGRDETVDAWVAIEALLPPGHRPHRPQVPFVGRDAEMGVLANAIDAAVERRRAHLLLLIGEAGVGKSRLAEEAASRARRHHDALVLEGRCVPYGEANVWWPIAEALRGACGVGADATLPDAERHCTESVARAMSLPADSPEVLRVTNGLLYLVGYEVPLREIDPQRAREEATRAVLTFLEGATAERPVVMVLSDLHWADQLVLDLVATLVERLARERFVLVATARQSVTDRWTAPTGRHNTMMVNLDPLDAQAAGELLDALLDADVPAPLRGLLLDRSGGNPFFLEELVALIGEGDLSETGLLDGTATLGELPDTLRGLVAARIDSLGPAERGSLEDASVWGRTGPVKALATMAEVMRHITDVTPVLDALVANEVIEIEGDHWSFRSDLIREVAYGTLTKADRARRHHGIAAYLASTVSTCEEAPERLVDMVAFHYGAAADLVAELGDVHGVPDDVAVPALEWLEEAARRAEVAQALPVAERLYSQAIRPWGPSGRRGGLTCSSVGPRSARSVARWTRPAPTSRPRTTWPCNSATKASSLAPCSCGARSSAMPVTWARRWPRSSAPSSTTSRSATSAVQPTPCARSACPGSSWVRTTRRRWRSGPHWPVHARSATAAVRHGRCSTSPGSRSSKAAPPKPRTVSRARPTRSPRSATSAAWGGRSACWRMCASSRATWGGPRSWASRCSSRPVTGVTAGARA
ncbi:MAG TPA: adenylate/guanylate cyclase domain-containing protein, partial [Acidimicrobiales bacterium]|nr:adenylate/guanylate cyclase domain-containing protein [Acidimicrobiales bacterium]